MDVQPTNLEKLCDAIMSKWAKISEECFQHLVESMPRRIKAVLNVKAVQHGTSKVYLIKWPVSSLRNHHLVSLNNVLVRSFKTFFEATKSSNIKINKITLSTPTLSSISFTPFTPHCVEYYINLKQIRHQRSAVFMMFVCFFSQPHLAEFST